MSELSFSLLPDMRKDVQEIFKMTPHEKQVMMFSATLSKEIRPVCKKFMNNVMLLSTSRGVSAVASALDTMSAVSGG